MRKVPKKLNHPLLMSLCHFRKTVLTLGAQLDTKGAAVIRQRRPMDQSLPLQLTRNARHVASRHHHPSRKFAHGEPLGHAGELGHKIKPRKRGAKGLTEPGPERAFYHIGAGEQTQPKPDGVVIPLIESGFMVQGANIFFIFQQEITILSRTF